MCIKEMHKDRAKSSRVLSRDAIEEETKVVDRVNRFDDLSNEGTLCSLTEFEGELEFAPDVFGSLDLRASGASRWCKRTRWSRSDPWKRVRQGGVAGVVHGEYQMSVKTSSKGGGNRSRVRADFVGQNEKGLVGGWTTNLGEHLVLEVHLGDVGTREDSMVESQKNH